MKVLEYESVHDECIYTIRAGESAQENWDLIESSAQNDIWFHVEGVASCHVVLNVGRRNSTPHKSVINFCAATCKEGSNVKFNKNVKIIYTKIKNVKIKKTDKPGTVTASNTKSTKI
jgi:predicted ribosome quality control (RQC) complex YloA/Tae2 family protein